MIENARGTHRREESLSRDRIIEASIAILDGSGESGLTFRTLAKRLSTGPGAIYWHIASKSELLTAACDTIVARTVDAPVTDATPAGTIRAVALAMFDTIDAHPWVGSVLTQAAAELPMVRILERLGQQVRALGVPDDSQWIAVSALSNYILGVGGQNAANSQSLPARGIDRSDFLDAVATLWSQLDPGEFPFARSVAEQLRAHDDRVDFLAGIDLILSGIESLRVR